MSSKCDCMYGLAIPFRDGTKSGYMRSVIPSRFAISNARSSGTYEPLRYFGTPSWLTPTPVSAYSLFLNACRCSHLRIASVISQPPKRRVFGIHSGEGTTSAVNRNLKCFVASTSQAGSSIAASAGWLKLSGASESIHRRHELR